MEIVIKTLPNHVNNRDELAYLKFALDNFFSK